MVGLEVRVFFYIEFGSGLFFCMRLCNRPGNSLCAAAEIFPILVFIYIYTII